VHACAREEREPAPGARGGLATLPVDLALRTDIA
jgi:hypothetical protein